MGTWNRTNEGYILFYYCLDCSSCPADTIQMGQAAYLPYITSTFLESDNHKIEIYPLVFGSEAHRVI